MTPSRTALRLAAGITAAALLSACGSTVQYSQSAQGTTGGGDLGTSTTDGGTSTGNGSTGSTTGSSDTSSSGSTSGSFGTTSGGTSAGTSTSGSSGTAGGTTGRGTSSTSGSVPTIPSGHTPITIGVVADDYSALASQFGVSTPTNYFDAYRAYFDYLNKHGGLNGHPIKAIYHTANGAATNAEQEAQTACTYFTQDNHVQLMLSLIYYSPTFAACLKKKGIAQIDNGQYGLTESDLNAQGNYISPEGLSLDREAVLELRGMTAAGVLNSKSVIGVILGGCSDEVNAYNKALAPLAKQLGYKVVTQQLSCYQGVASLSSATSDIQAAVLRFQSNNVNQVFAFTASEGYVLTVFMKQASSQKYYPGYLLTSNGYPFANTTGSGTASYSEDARTRIHGMGWGPFYETGPQAKATGAVLAAQNQCTKMDPTQGGSRSADATTRYNELQLFFSVCDQLSVIKLIAQHTNDFGISSIRNGFNQFSGSIVAAGGYLGKIGVSAQHGDGATTAAPFSYKASCSCVTLDGPAQLIPSS